jgi:uncharacterized protein (DUF885 family)
MSSRTPAALVLLLAACGSSPPPPAPPPPPVPPPPVASVAPPAPGPSADERYEKLWSHFLAEYLRLRPVDATTLGNHEHDGEWPDLTVAGEAERRRLDEQTRAELATLPASELSADHALDAEILGRTLDYDLFVLDRLRPAETDPLATYVRPLGDGLDPFVSRDFAPAPVRARSLAARLAGIGKVVAAARARVGHPARIVTETAIKQTKGLLGLVDGGFPQLLAQAPAEKPAVLAAAKQASQSIHELLAFLQNEVLPRSDGDFRVGADRFRTILRLTLDPNVDADDLEARARATLASTQEEMADTAKGLWPELFPKQKLPDVSTPQARKAMVRKVLARLSEDRPTSATIVRDATKWLAEATEFVRSHDLVTLPDEPVKVMEMPEYERGVAIAFCEASGPLEQKAETHVTISPAPADWLPARVTSFYKEYDQSMLANLMVHEAMPGHYLQLMHMAKVGAAARAVFTNDAFVEGWAVYSEWLMAHHGFGGPRVKLQREKMLLRVCANAILDHEIHAGTMDEKAALDLMENEAFQEEGEAVGKWTRARVSHGQLSFYFYGFSELMKMRQAAEKQPGFAERAYHDRVLSFGAPSLQQLRARMAL